MAANSLLRTIVISFHANYNAQTCINPYYIVACRNSNFSDTFCIRSYEIGCPFISITDMFYSLYSIRIMTTMLINCLTSDNVYRLKPIANIPRWTLLSFHCKTLPKQSHFMQHSVIQIDFYSLIKIHSWNLIYNIVLRLQYEIDYFWQCFTKS